MKKDIAHLVHNGKEKIQLRINKGEFEKLQTNFKHFTGSEWVYIDLDMMRLLKLVINPATTYTLTNEDQKPIKN